MVPSPTGIPTSPPPGDGDGDGDGGLWSAEAVHRIEEQSPVYGRRGRYDNVVVVVVVVVALPCRRRLVRTTSGAMPVRAQTTLSQMS